MCKGAVLQIDTDCILRAIELLLLLLTRTLLLLRGSRSLSGDALAVSGCAFIIILVVLMALKCFNCVNYEVDEQSKDSDEEFEEWDEKFEGYLLTIGAILLISTGLLVAILAGMRHDSAILLSGGIFGTLGGCTLLVHALLTFIVSSCRR